MLFDYIQQRQLATFGPQMGLAGRFGRWMSLPDGTAMYCGTLPAIGGGYIFKFEWQVTDIEQRRALDFPGANILDLRIDNADAPAALQLGQQAILFLDIGFQVLFLAIPVSKLDRYCLA